MQVSVKVGGSIYFVNVLASRKEVKKSLNADFAVVYRKISIKNVKNPAKSTLNTKIFIKRY